MWTPFLIVKMRNYFLVLLGLLLGACASAPAISTQYSGKDLGAAVVAIGAPPGYHYTSYSLRFRKVGETTPSGTPTGTFQYKTRSFLIGDAPDYQIEGESGVVVSATLPAGKYEIFDFALFFTNRIYSENFSSSSPFSIPFEVRTGETAYLGNYFALPRYGARRLGVPQRAGALFTVENRQETDTAIARKKSLGTLAAVVANYTPSVEQLSRPFFITREQRERIQKQDQEE